MYFYKIINNKTFVGVITSLDFRRFQPKHSILVMCDEALAQYVQFDDSLYRSSWMKPVQTDKFSYSDIELIEISEEEFNILAAAAETGEEIVIEEPTIEEEIPPANPIEEVTLDYVKTMKVKEMNEICNAAITNGVDVVLADGKARHFSMGVEDQINIASLSAMVMQGQQAIPYHADGELCTFFSVEDFQAVVTAFTNWKIYHESYFNSLRSYVNSMDSIADVSSVTYGVVIPLEYQSVVLKQLMASMQGGV